MESTRLVSFRNKLRLAKYCLGDISKVSLNRDLVPCVYFNDGPNVGDQLNPYLISRLALRKIIHVRTNIIRHIRVCGSTLDSASQASCIAGSGSISGKSLRKRLNPSTVYALRGNLSLQLARDNLCDLGFECPLGDPAVLMNQLYTPLAIKKFRLGIVPHYVDEALIAASLEGSSSDDVTLISVSLGVEEFIDRISECNFLLSSSLHGLILADTYGIPNRRIIVSDKIIGGSYKFHDYYTTTRHKDDVLRPLSYSPDIISSSAAMLDSICSVSQYMHSSSALARSIVEAVSQL
jgi:pyruvyltransferase